MIIVVCEDCRYNFKLTTSKILNLESIVCPKCKNMLQENMLLSVKRVCEELNKLPHQTNFQIMFIKEFANVG